MKYILILGCLLLLFYNFEITTLLSGHRNASILSLWKITEDIYLVQIFPHNVHILIEKDNYYLYLEKDYEETYVPAINLKNNFQIILVNYIYIRNWTEFAPQILSYSDTLTDLTDILNSLF